MSDQGSGWRNQLDLGLSGLVGADGTLTLEIIPGSVPFIVTQVTIEMTDAPIGGTCELRKLDKLVTLFQSPIAGVAAGQPTMVLQPGEQANIIWRNCTPGETGSALVFYSRGAY